MKKKLLLSISLVLLLNIIIISSIAFSTRAANGLGFRWLRNDTIDDLLTLVGNKAGDDEIVLEWNLNEFGQYELKYHLNDNRYTIIRFNHEVDRVNIRYGIYDKDDNAITQSEINKSYQEMDYNALVPGWVSPNKTVNDDGTVSYSIIKAASAQYPGVAFRINNVDVKIRWNFQTNKLFFLTKGVESGNITPFTLTTPLGDVETLQILRSLRNFVINPTHWVGNENKTKIVIPSDNEKPGGRPGLQIRFDQPKAFDFESKTFKMATDLDDITAIIDLNEVNGTAYTDFTITMDRDLDRKIINAPNTQLDQNKNSHSKYRYEFNESTGVGTYIIDIVKDKSVTDFEEDFIQWHRLAASRVYSVGLYLSESSKYAFANYDPRDRFGYTYIQYEVKRANMENAYLDVIPYAGSDENDLEYTVYHSKNEKSHYDTSDIWLKHYHSKNHQDTNIYIPVPFLEGSNQEFYQIGVNFAARQLRSQIIKYIPNIDLDVPPPTPRIDELLNLIVVPSIHDDNDPEKIQFDLIWEAPTNTINNPLLSNMLNTGKIYYELLINQQPNGTSVNPYELLKVFEVSKENGQIRLVEVNTGKEQGTPLHNNIYRNGYNNQHNRFGIRNIVIKDSEGWTTIPNKEENIEDKTYIASEGTEIYNFEFPGIHFLRMRAVYVSTQTYGYSDMSVPTSISLDTIRFSIPIPTSLSYEPIIPTSANPTSAVEVGWKGIDITDYANFMLYPLGLSPETITYKWYMASTKEALNKEEDIYQVTMTSGNSLPLSSNEIDELRKGKVISSEIVTAGNQTGDISFYVQNLDPNHTYYFKVRAELNIKDENQEEIIKESENSPIITIISPTIPNIPDEDLILPLAPNNLDVTFVDDSQMEAYVQWDYPSELIFNEGKQGFEVVVVRDRGLPQELQQKELKISDVISGLEQIEANKVVYRLFKDNTTDTYKLLKYNNTTKAFEESDQIVEITNNRVRIKDKGLLANTIYYYHVRTVNLEGNHTLASNWMMDTITTKPIAPPINLVIPTPSPYSYDGKRETVVRFDAPIPFPESDSDKYRIEIFVKGPDDTDYTSSYQYSLLGKSNNASDGYTRMFYKIFGLKPGKPYSIKVRIEDRTKEPEILPNGTVVYPKSNFSDRVQTRTDFDQVDYDKEQKYKQYIDYYLSKVEELKDGLYWTVNQNNNSIWLKYRQNKIASNNLKNQFELATKNKESLYYYLPGEMIETLNRHNTTILINTVAEQIGVRPNTIGLQVSGELQKVKNQINQLPSNFKDYYVLLQVKRGTFNGKINGQDPLTSLVDIQFKVIQSRLTEDEMERHILNTLDVLAGNYKNSLIVKLENELSSGINDDRLYLIVNEVLAEVQKAHQVQIGALMEQNTKDNNVPIDKMNRPMYISWGINNTANGPVIAYYRNNLLWENIGLTHNLGRYQINANHSGSYILTSDNRSRNIYGENVYAMVSEHNFMDFFTVEELNNSMRKPTKHQIVSSLARVMGASRTTNPIDHLNTIGISINRADMHQPMAKELAYNILLRGYEIKKNISFNNVTITNFNLIVDSNLIHTDYRRRILAGGHLKLVPLEEGYFSPKTTINTRELFDFLSRLQ
ncbi:hypothetical protein EDC18_10944 [Natranaerovirga pectinivora]|uniref:Fibronectin type-III domain-containing protein n=1 Tax=Natranaerovirga pectinivora TaxID=682400 RepID=A0A4R3MGY2_9FIRM|nr:hypothetical protein [Natranaerovirga pectinivora]TCT13081.1 hypothetical protein EDC18_10944 [Natranaerovirga pectinivora]